VELDSFENAIVYPIAMLDDSLRTANAWAAQAMGARVRMAAVVNQSAAHFVARQRGGVPECDSYG